MRRRTFVALGLLALPLVACGSESPTRSTSSSSVTATSEPNVAPTQTRAAELAQVSALQTQVASKPTAAVAQAPAATVAPSIAATMPVAATTAPPTATIVRTPTAAPAKVELTTSNILAYKGTSDAGYVIGVVTNTGQGEADRIQLAASLISDAGQTVGAGSISDLFFPVRLLKPGERTPFSAYIEKMPAAWKEVRVQVQAGQPTTASKASNYFDMKIEGAALNLPSARSITTTVTGQVTNTGTGTSRYVGMTVGLFDAADKLLSVGNSYANLEQIGPGISSPWSIEFYDVKGTPVRFEAVFSASRVS